MLVVYLGTQWMSNAGFYLGTQWMSNAGGLSWYTMDEQCRLSILVHKK